MPFSSLAPLLAAVVGAITLNSFSCANATELKPLSGIARYEYHDVHNHVDDTPYIYSPYDSGRECGFPGTPCFAVVDDEDKTLANKCFKLEVTQDEDHAPCVKCTSTIFMKVIGSYPQAYNTDTRTKLHLMDNGFKRLCPHVCHTATGLQCSVDPNVKCLEGSTMEAPRKMKIYYFKSSEANCADAEVDPHDTDAPRGEYPPPVLGRYNIAHRETPLPDSCTCGLPENDFNLYCGTPQRPCLAAMHATSNEWGCNECYVVQAVLNKGGGSTSTNEHFRSILVKVVDRTRNPEDPENLEVDGDLKFQLFDEGWSILCPYVCRNGDATGACVLDPQSCEEGAHPFENEQNEKWYTKASPMETTWARADCNTGMPWGPSTDNNPPAQPDDTEYSYPEHSATYPTETKLAMQCLAKLKEGAPDDASDTCGNVGSPCHVSKAMLDDKDDTGNCYKLTMEPRAEAALPEHYDDLNVVHDAHEYHNTLLVQVTENINQKDNVDGVMFEMNSVGWAKLCPIMCGAPDGGCVTGEHVCSSESTAANSLEKTDPVHVSWRQANCQTGESEGSDYRGEAEETVTAA